jgi:hypothetical protein
MSKPLPTGRQAIAKGNPNVKKGGAKGFGICNKVLFCHPELGSGSLISLIL